MELHMTSTHNTIGRGLCNRAVNGGNDDYFTPWGVAQWFVAEIAKHAPEGAQWIEPAAGAGVFLKAAKKAGISAVGYDIAPQAGTVNKLDWLKGELPQADVVFGNPPFGFAASLAVRFFNRAAETKAKVIAFILPASFRKASIHRRLSTEYTLVHDDAQRIDFELPNGGTRTVPCVLQIWVRQPRIVLAKDYGNDLVEWTTQDKAHVAIRRVGGQAGCVLPLGKALSKSTTYFIRARTVKVKRALFNTDFTSGRDHTAGVRSVSKEEIIKCLREAM